MYMFIPLRIVSFYDNTTSSLTFEFPLHPNKGDK